MLVVSSRLKYRREWFGCVVLDLSSQKTRFFNRSAAFLIEQFFSPSNPEDVFAAAEIESSWHDFVPKLVSAGVLSSASENDGISVRNSYHLDVDDFTPNVFHSPLGIEIELTRRCSRKCTYCSYDSSPTVSTVGELDTKTWKRVLDDAVSGGVMFVRFTGGDPLLREDFWELADYAGQVGLLVTVGTDLSTFKESDARRFAALENLYLIQTTLDGPSQESADRQRGNGNYKKVLYALSKLQEYRVPFMVSMVVTAENADMVAQTASLAKTLGARHFVASPLYSAGRGKDVMNIAPSDAQLLATASQARSVSFSTDEDSFFASLPTSAGLEPGSMVRDEDWLSLPSGLRSADKYLRIDSAGNAYISIKAIDALGDAAYAGHVDDGIRHVWRESPVLGKVRSIPHADTQFGRVVALKDVLQVLRSRSHDTPKAQTH